MCSNLARPVADRQLSIRFLPMFDHGSRELIPPDALREYGSDVDTAVVLLQMRHRYKTNRPIMVNPTKI
jgi:hypothetical protein